MTQMILDLFFAFTFLALLILLFRIKSRAFIDNKDSYRYILGGISVFCITSILQLAANQGMFESLPFLSEPVYLEVVKIIGIVAGITFLIAGISIWLPGRTRKDNISGVKPELKKNIDRIILRVLNGKAIEAVFRIAPKIISRCFGFDSWIVIRVCHRKNSAILTDSGGITGDTIALAHQALDFDGPASHSFSRVREMGRSSYDLPIRINNRQVAGIFFWQRGQKWLNEGDMVLLDRIAEILSFRLSSEYARIKGEFFEQCWRNYFQIISVLQNRGNLKEKIQPLYHLFNNAVGAEYMSLAVTEQGRNNIRRYSAGINGNVLLDGVINPAMQSRYIYDVLENKKGIRIGNVMADGGESADPLFISCGQKNLMAIPVICDGRPLAVLTLGHSCPNKFNRRDRLRVEILATALSQAVEAELGRRSLFERDRLLGAITAFDSTVSKCRDIESILQAAARTISKNTMTTMVRITTYDNEQNLLTTRALETIRPIRDMQNDNVIVSDALAFWHNMVIQENRLLLINQQNIEASMDKIEAATLVFPEMKSALIVPIKVNDKIYGMITLGEMREWNRYSYNPSVINFCKEIALQTAGGIKQLKLEHLLLKNINPSDKAVAMPNRTQELFSRLNSPASRLRGSLDLIRQKGLSREEGSDEILSMMEKSADEIMSVLHDR